MRQERMKSGFLTNHRPGKVSFLQTVGQPGGQEFSSRIFSFHIFQVDRKNNN